MAFRRIFPSFKWEDAWLVNQVVNRPKVVGVHEMGFVNGVPPEEVHSSDEAIKRWIRKSMVGCSCLVLFVGGTSIKAVGFALSSRKPDVSKWAVSLFV